MTCTLFYTRSVRGRVSISMINVRETHSTVGNYYRADRIDGTIGLAGVGIPCLR